MSYEVMLDFFAEAGKLKRVKRSGWWMIGVPDEESVADHSFRCAVIGYFLAKKEKADVGKVVLMSLLNDFHEARMNDLHKMAHRYLDVRKGERKAFKEQVERLEADIREELMDIRIEHDRQDSLEGKLARDADILECLLQAKEYLDLGYPNAEKFFKKAPDHLFSNTAKKLWTGMSEWDSNGWWEDISEFER